MFENCQRDCVQSLLLTLTLFVCLAVDPFGFTSFLPVKASLFLLGGAMCLFLVLFTAPRIFRDAGARNFAIIAGLLPLASTISWFFAVDTDRFRETAPVWPQHPILLWAGWAVAVAMAHSWRTAREFHLWIKVLLFAGLVISIFAWAQKFGMVPVAFPGSWVGSLAGGPIYLAGTLLFILPLAVWKLATDLRAEASSPRRGWLVSACVLMLLFGAFLIAEKRGPMLALFIGSCAGLVLLGVIHNKRKLLLWAVGVAIAGAAFLSMLAVLQKAGLPLREIPVVGRLAMIVPVGERSGDLFRRSLWESASTFADPANPLLFPDGTTDPLPRARFWIGYGPDSVEAVLPTRWVFTPSWPKPFIEKTCHSIFWDTWLAFGFLGLASLLILMACVFWWGLRGLGIATATRKDLGAYCLFTVAGMIVGGLALRWLYGGGYFGLGTQLGLPAGVLLFAATRAKIPATQRSPGSRQHLLLALMVGLIAHWVDMAFISQTGITGPLFWMFLGAIAWLGSQTECAQAGGTDPPDSWFFSPIWMLVVSMLLSIGMIHPDALWNPERLWLAGTWQQLSLLVAVALPAGLYARKLALATSLTEVDVLRVFGAVLAGFALVWAALWAFGMTLGSAEATTSLLVMRAVALASWMWTLLFLLMFVVLCLQTKNKGVAGFGVLVAVIGALIASFASVPWIRGEIFHGVAGRVSDPVWKVQLLEAALSDRPGNYRARMSLSAQPDELLGDNSPGRSILEEGLKISQFNLLSMDLGEKILRQSLESHETNVREQLAREALEEFTRAGRTIPQNETTWFMASLVAGHLLADTPLAEYLKARADAATEQLRYPNLPVNTLAWADLHLSKSISWQKTEFEDPLLDRALHYYLRAWEESMAAMEGKTRDENAAKFWNPRLFWILTGKGHTLRRLGRYSEAAEAYRRAADIPWEERPFDPLPLAGAAESVHQEK